MDRTLLAKPMHKFEPSLVGQKNSVPKLQVYNKARLDLTQWGRQVESAVGAHLANRSVLDGFDLLMKAVRKAISLGNKTAKSLRWMEKVSNRDDYEVSVCVYPFWQDDRSRTGYVPAKKSRASERDRLTGRLELQELRHG